MHLLRHHSGMSLNFSHLAVLLIVLVVAAAVITLFVSALLSIAKSETTGTEKAVWILITLLFPIAGPLIWFFVRNNAGRKAQPPTPPSAS